MMIVESTVEKVDIFGIRNRTVLSHDVASLVVRRNFKLVAVGCKRNVLLF